MKTKVILGMSGGVDSSVAAFLLKNEGYCVEGLFMKNWEQDDSQNDCPAARDFLDAQSVARQLDIRLHTVNFSTTYWDEVFQHFLDEYAKGRTPNPDVLCNKEIKFKAFLHHAKSLGADYIATGHYAKTRDGLLYKAKDREKDQTYFLHAVEKEALLHTLFPIGQYLKTTIRDIAKSMQFTTHNKKDSTGICFIGEKRFKTFLQEFMLAKPGDIESTQGQLLGRHDGLMFYTLGQRQGLGIGGKKTTQNEPWYVVEKDIPHNRLIVAQGNDHPRLYANGLIASQIHWISTKPSSFPYPCHAKTRYRQPDEACLLTPIDNEQFCVLFTRPQRAITPGQYVVFYNKNECLGGAVIDSIIY